ncbi:hypothetical protein ACFL6N_03375 [Thermodesulfobacteriota bacterium]
MKKVFLKAALVALFISLASTVYAAPKTLNVVFDGYCDGVSITYDMSTGYATGASTGCVVGNQAGTVGSIAAQGTGGTLAWDQVADYAGMILILHAQGTWELIMATDASYINSGTWTVGFPAKTSDLPSAAN